MLIQRVSVQNFRSHTEKTITLSPATTVIVGSNGAGKTSLLEALYISLRGVSFKGSDSDILRHDTDWWRIDMLLEDTTTRSVTFDPSRPYSKKQFIVHDKKSIRLPAKDKYPVVLFEPDHLRLLHGSPARRREFIDTLLSQLDPNYTALLRKYDRSLRQRNTLLKQSQMCAEDIFVWNVALSDFGAQIIEKRVYAVELLNQTVNDHYRDIAKTTDEISIHYSHTVIDGLAQKLLRELEQAFDYDRAVKYTSVGPHRHDIKFHFNEYPALAVASRGEVRSILLALKRIEAVIIKKLLGKEPIMLLDDVFGELDETRRKSLTYLGAQQIITSTDTGGVAAGDGIAHVFLGD